MTIVNSNLVYISHFIFYEDLWLTLCIPDRVGSSRIRVAAIWLYSSPNRQEEHRQRN